MNAEQWQLVKDIFGSAMETAPAERVSFIIKACASDDEVRREVEKLLDSFDDEYMQEPVISEVARQFENEHLQVGDVIGHYKVSRRLGAGGMGEVYLAEDTKLDRLVALKILPQEALFDPSAGRRLIHEAKAAAALDHPNIGTVYEVGEADGHKFIAMQYLKGETLAERLSRGSIAAAEVVEIAIQIADALSEAHARGVVHRDIKPSNVMIDGDGRVKVLDFSLAKRSALTGDETTESLFSRPGMIFGTVAYMSPEQARGNVTDARTDVWSFGVLLYEMLTGRNPFSGATTSDTLAAILTSDVPALGSPDVPEQLESIIRRALKKDASDRFASISEILIELRSIPLDELQKNASEVSQDRGLDLETTQRQRFSTDEIEGAFTGDQDRPRDTWRFLKPASGTWVTLIACLLVVGIVGWFIAVRFGSGPPSSPPPPPTRSQLTSWKRNPGEDLGRTAKFSPDGKLIAFASTQNGVNSIWLKQIGGGDAFPQKQDQWPETDPIFSPDGAQIAFLSKRGTEYGIWVRPTLGGSTPKLLIAIDEIRPQLIKWGKDGDTLYFASRNNVFLLRLSSRQVEDFLITGSNFASSFALSPDEQRVAFVDWMNGRTDIWVATKNGEPTRVTDDEFVEGGVVWHPDGQRILYDGVQGGISHLMVCPTSGATPITVLSSDSPLYLSDVSPDGKSLLYYSQQDRGDLSSVEVDGSRETRLTDTLEVELWPAVSPDRNQIAFLKLRSVDVTQVFTQASVVSRPFGSDGREAEIVKDGFSATWSPDGSKMAFLRWTDAGPALWVTPVAGGEQLKVGAEGVQFGGITFLPYNPLYSQDYQWSLDGTSIVYAASRESISNLWIAPADGNGEKQLTNNVDKNVSLWSPFFSPDGDRIAFLRRDQTGPEFKQTIWSVWVLSGDGIVTMIRRSDSVLGIVGWSASGGHVIVKQIPATLETATPASVDLLEISSADGTSRHLATFSHTYPKSLSLSPDREKLAFVVSDDGFDSLQVADLVRTTRTTILKSGEQRVLLGGLTWLRDGRSIVFGKYSNWQMISIIENFK